MIYNKRWKTIKEDEMKITDDNTLVDYTQKGQKHLKTFRISATLFDMIYSRIPNPIYVPDSEVFQKACYGLWCKATVLYMSQLNDNKNSEKMIMGTYILFAKLNNIMKTTEDKVLKKTCKRLISVIDGHYYDYVLVKDASLSNDIISTVTPRQVKNDFKKVAKDLTTDDLQKIVDDIGVDEKHRHTPLCVRTTVFNTITKHEDCLYMDIHKAHSKFIIDTFKDYPKIVNWVNNYNKKSAEAKKKGNLEEAKMYKDYPNLLVGCLGQINKKTKQSIKWLKDVDTRPLYNRCVNDVYEKITNQILDISLEQFTKIVYAQTDGFIVSHPNWSKVKDSKEVGEFGIEKIDNNVVWTYRQKTTEESTGYCIYQYFQKGKKKVVGDLPDILKGGIDLSKGIVVYYKESRDDNGKCHYNNVNYKEI